MLVIGGGITGAGVALDAASRGLTTALVERDDFASGTSSKSSKLVHGGLRYLQHREFKLVYENLYERQIALEERTAPRAHPSVPHPRALQGRADEREARPGAGLRPLAVRLHRWPAHREAAQADQEGRGGRAHAHAAVAEHRGRVHLLRRADRRRPAHADDRAHRRNAGRGDRQPHERHRPAQGRVGPHHRGDRRGRRPDDRHRCEVRGQRDRCLVGRHPGVRRAGAPALDPPGQGHPHHGAVEQGAQRHRGDRPGAEGQALDLRGALGRLHLHRHDRHRLRRPARRPRVHGRGHRLPAQRDEPRPDRAADQATTSSAPGPGCAR